MSESQSRYSIVERLTEKKLNLIREKSEIENGIKRKQEEVAEIQSQLKEHETDVKYRQAMLQQEMDNSERELQRNERKAKSSLESAQAHRKDKESAIDAQITALEIALVKIEEVSKTAGSQS